MSKKAEEILTENGEWNPKALRGAFHKWLDRDWTLIGDREATIPHDGKGEPVSTAFKKWESWINQKVDDDYFELKDGYGVDEPRRVFNNYWDEKESFKEEVMSHVEVNGINRGEGSKEEDQGSSVNREYKRLSEKDLINENMDPNWSKLRGTMLLFAREVDEIHGTEKTFDLSEVVTAWHRWMQDKFDSEWVNFTYHHVSSDDMRSAVSTLHNSNTEFRGLVESKYEYDPDENSGNGDPDDNGEGSGDDGKVKFGNQTFDKADKLERSDNGESDTKEEDPKGITDFGGEGVESKRRVSTGKQSGDEDSKSGGRSHENVSLREYVASRAERDDELKTGEIYKGNVWSVLDQIPRKSIDAVVTSPPYWALRDYDGGEYQPIGGDPRCDHAFNDGKCHYCGAWQGQLGHEPEKEMFIHNIVAIMEKVKAILKPTGHLFLNIGDTYDDKSAQMVPERVYARMIDEGWYLRDKIVWAKKVYMADDGLVGNGQPSPHDDRIAHQWEPHYHFVKSKDYWIDVDSNRVMPSSFDGDMGKPTEDSKYDEGEDGRRGRQYNPMGTNQPDIWQINSDGYTGDHSAVFPEELPGRSVELSVPERVCGNCGKPYKKENIVDNEDTVSPGGDRVEWEQPCACKEDYEPGVVCDIFLGSGTTAKAAAEKGYRWCGIEMSEKYIEEAESRIPDGLQKSITNW